MKQLPLLLVTILLVCLLLPPGGPAFSMEQASEFDKGLSYLLSQDFNEKEDGIKLVGTSGDPLAEQTLELILAGKLHYLKKEKQLVTIAPAESGYAITSFPGGDDLGSVSKRKVKKVTINNQLRGTLKNLLALVNLSHPESAKRLEAAKAILPEVSPNLLPVLNARYQAESDSEVKEILETALIISNLDHQQSEKRLEAVKKLQGNLFPSVKNRILHLLENEKDPEIVKVATATLASIENSLAWNARVETLFFGLSMGSVLVLAAIGLAITFGVIGVINMAHGELIMIGAYTTYVLQQLMPDAIGFALALSVPAAFCVSGGVGILIEKSVIRFLYGRPLETLLATFGISLVLQQAVRSIFSPLNRSVATPDWMSGSIIINPVLSLTTNRVTIFFFALIVFVGLYLLLKKKLSGPACSGSSPEQIHGQGHGGASCQG